jgi:hypothetical protein
MKGTVMKSFSGQLKNELLFYPKGNKLIKGHVAHDLELFKEAVNFLPIFLVVKVLFFNIYFTFFRLFRLFLFCFGSIETPKHPVSI